MTLNEHERLDIDLDALLEGATPSVLTPNLTEIASLSNEKKPKRVAQLLVKHLHQQLGTPPAKEILHDGAIHQIRYFDIEPMMKGVWCEMSLMLLHLSYGEQCTLIEALYPKDVQLAAKVFASHFTKSLSVEKVDIFWPASCPWVIDQSIQMLHPSISKILKPSQMTNVSEPNMRNKWSARIKLTHFAVDRRIYGI